MTATLPSLAALSLTLGAILHSYAYMCRKLPALRERHFPSTPARQLLLELGWLLLAGGGFVCAWRIETSLLLVAGLLYFVVLPLLIQPALAKLLGFDSLRAFIETVDAQGEDADN